MGIALGSNFDVQTSLPLDSRMVVADVTARNAIDSGRRYLGLEVFVVADQKKYILKAGITNSDWVFSGGIDPTGSTTGQVLTSTGPTTDPTFQTVTPTATSNISNGVVNLFNRATLTTSVPGSNFKVATVGARPAGQEVGAGSPQLTYTYAYDDALGTNTFTITKAAANAQGEYLRIPIIAGATEQGKVITVSFEVSHTGTYVQPATGVDSTFIAYVINTDGFLTNNYDELSVLKIGSSLSSTGITTTYRGEYQLRVTSVTAPALMIYCARTDTTSCVLTIKNLKITPSTYVYGSPVTDWQSYTPAFQGLGTPSNVNFKWRRNGSSIDIEGYLATGATTAAEARIGLPNGYVSSSKYVSVAWVAGDVTRAATSAQTVYLAVQQSKTYLVVTIQSSGAAGSAPVNGNTAFGSTENLTFKASVEIEGLSSSVQMSDQADTRIVALKAKATAATAVDTDIVFATVSKDTHSAFNVSKNSYTVQVPGDYQVSCTLNMTFQVSAASELLVYVNGTLKDVIARGKSYGAVEAAIIGGSAIFENLKTGDTVSVRFKNFVNTGAMSGSSTDTATYGTLSISRLSGPSAIAATELISASYWVSASFAASTTVPINFDSKEFDTHGAVSVSPTAWRFTAPASGEYRIDLITGVTATTIDLYLYKNGTLYKSAGGSAGSPMTSGGASLKLIAGDYIDIRPSGAKTFYGGVLASTSSTISIKRSGL